MYKHRLKKESLLEAKEDSPIKDIWYRKTPKIIAQPTEEDLRPTEQEKRQMQELWDWEEQSKKTDWVLGEPVPRSLVRG